jgi:hypothetical protein
MSNQRFPQFKALEGRRVGLALSDGSRIDDCQLISAGRPGLESVWVFLNGNDAFIPLTVVIEVWEVGSVPTDPVRAA